MSLSEKDMKGIIYIGPANPPEVRGEDKFLVVSQVSTWIGLQLYIRLLLSCFLGVFLVHEKCITDKLQKTSTRDKPQNTQKKKNYNKNTNL